MRGVISNTDANGNADSHSYCNSNRKPYGDCNSYSHSLGYANCHTQRNRNAYSCQPRRLLQQLHQPQRPALLPV